MKAYIILLLLLCACAVQETTIQSEKIKAATQEAAKIPATAEAENPIVPVQQVETATVPLIEKIIKTLIANKTVIAIGDSLTYGQGSTISWVSIYANNSKLYNYAISGATTYSARYYQLELMKNITGIKQVFLWIGANDVVNLISLQDFETNYRAIVKEIINMEGTELILLNIPDASKLSVADTVQTEAEKLLAQYGVKTNVKTVTREVLNQYNQIIQTIANENNLKLIDMFNYLDTFDDSMITSDRFHPNEKGHKLIAEKVKEEVK